jgi:hypothetical protein
VYEFVHVEVPLSLLVCLQSLQHRQQCAGVSPKSGMYSLKRFFQRQSVLFCFE